MLRKIVIAGVHATADKNLQKYVQKKIGRLDRYVPRNARGSAHADVKLKEGNARDGNHCCAEVIMHLPHETVTISEKTVNMYAAVDIVEAKLRIALKKYKETHGTPRFSKRLLSKVRQQMA